MKLESPAKTQTKIMKHIIHDTSNTIRGKGGREGGRRGRILGELSRGPSLKLSEDEDGCETPHPLPTARRREAASHSGPNHQRSVSEKEHNLKPRLRHGSACQGRARKRWRPRRREAASHSGPNRHGHIHAPHKYKTNVGSTRTDGSVGGSVRQVIRDHEDPEHEKARGSKPLRTKSSQPTVDSGE